MDAKIKYAKALKAVKAADPNLYNYCTGKSASIQVYLLPSKDPSLTKTINGKQKYLQGYADRNEIKTNSNFDRLDVREILYDASSKSTKIVEDAVLIEKISTMHKEQLVYAAKEKRVTDQCQIIIDRVREINQKAADALVDQIVNEGEVFDEMIDTLYFLVKEAQVGEFMTIGPKDIKVYLNYGDLKGNDVQFSKKLAHELTHVYYGMTHQLNVLKWSVIRGLKDIHKYELADEDDPASTLFNKACSAGYGHERHNPENITVCGSENSY